jgi:tRNA threonylcarbamoyl adenosine modification protein YeaZ
LQGKKCVFLQRNNLIYDRFADSILIPSLQTGKLKDKSKNERNTHKTGILNNMQTPDNQNRHSTQKPLILAVETSGRAGSVAIALGGQLLAEATFSAPMSHSAETLPAVHSMLERFGRQPREIEHIYISAGPGSFTGLRIAVTIAKAMHLANAAKIVAVDTLAVIVANATDYAKKKNLKLEKIAAVLDAKRGQFFIAAYQKKKGQWSESLPACLMTAPQFLDKFAVSGQPVWLLGEGLVYYADAFKADGIQFLDRDCWSPRAGKVHSLGYEKALAGQFADALTLTPTYLRRPEVEEKWQLKI